MSRLDPPSPSLSGTVLPAPFACRPEESRGRDIPEPESPTRTCFQRDRDRMVAQRAGGPEAGKEKMVQPFEAAELE